MIATATLLLPPELPVAEFALSVIAIAAVIIGAAAWAVYVYFPANVRKWNNLTMELSTRLAALESDRQRDYTEMQRLRLRLTELEIGVRVLIAQVKRLGEAPEWNGHDAAETVDASPAPVDETALYRGIAALFDVDEIDDLAYRLGIAPDDIEGIRRDTRARHLVQHTARRGMVDELRAAAQELRPDGGF